MEKLQQPQQYQPSVFGMDAYSPDEVANRVERIGVTKVRLPIVTTIMLGIMGGGFIGLGAMYHLLILAHPDLTPGTAFVLSSVCFAMGYIIALLAGAEVFTTNNLSIMSWAARQIGFLELMSNWVLVLLANVVGSFGIVLLVVLSGHAKAYDGALAAAAVALSVDKLSASQMETFFQGVLGNLLICIAVWVSMAGRSVTDKVLGVILPVSAMSAGGFQHCIGNIYPVALALLFTPEMGGELAAVLNVPNMP